MKALLTTLITSLALGLFAQTTVNGSFIYDGESRSYKLYVPAVYSSGSAVPIVLNLHGYGSNNTQQMAYTDFESIADTANFLILAPQGLPDPINSSAHWNANWGTGIDDIGFINALLDTISNNYTVNQDRIYSTGMSNGGFMSLTLAGQLDNRIAAVASVTGTMSSAQIPANTVTRPVPVMQIHGTNDPTVNYNGDATLTFLSVADVLTYWIDHNNCSTTAVFTAIADVNTSDGCTAEKYEYLGGDNGSEVVHYKIIDGEHTWPGTFPIAVTNQDFNACKVIWEFFSKYEKATLVSITEVENQENWFNILGENPTSGFVNFQSTDNSDFTVSILDLNGKLLKTIKNNIGTAQVDLTNEVAGVYIASIKDADHTAIFKIIKR